MTATPSNASVEAYTDLLSTWARRAKRSLDAHYAAARSLSWRHNVVGGLLIVASVITTTLAGRNLFGFASMQIDSFVTLSSALTLALASLHVFLRDGDRANQHKHVASRYAGLKRRLETAITEILAGDPIVIERVEALSAELDSLGESALGVPPRIWNSMEGSKGLGEIGALRGDASLQIAGEK